MCSLTMFFPNPTDTRTLIPFLDTIEANFFELPEYIVADAGYGSEQNYKDIIENRKERHLLHTISIERRRKRNIRITLFM